MAVEHRTTVLSAARTSWHVPSARALPGLIRSGRLRYLLGVGILTALYYVAAKIGYELRFTGAISSLVWLPAGVAMSYLAVDGLRFWPGALLGDLLVNDYSTVTLGGAIGQTTGNLIEVMLGAYLLRRLMRRGSPLDTTASVIGLVGALAVSTAASALIGPLSLLASNAVSSDSLLTVVRTWWLGDLCGALVVVPVALAWLGPTPKRPEQMGHGRALSVLAATAVLVWISMLTEQRVAYIAFPALLYAAVRCGSRTATVAVAVTAAAAVWATTHYEGPFIFHTISHSVLSTQLFIVVSAVSTLFVAALVSERELAIRRAEESRTETLLAQYAERQRLERDLHDGLQQRLLGLLLDLKQAGKANARRPLEEVVEEAGDGLVDALYELRAIARGTYPPMLTEVGLGGAIDEIAVRSSVPLVVHEVPTERFDLATETVAYFVIAEAVTNAQKHASAAEIGVRVYTSDGTVRIVVSDDGVGGAFEEEGSGLAGLRNRLESVEGTFRIESPAGDGTTIHATIPRLAPPASV
jgi:signal transduction histidine kinase